MVNILYLCTGNSCRSQIAEGWTRQLGGNRVEVQSAGIEAHGKNPRAIKIMQDAGCDISGQESTIVSEEMLQRADVVVTVCGHADEQCPSGSEQEIMNEFRAPRDEVEKRVRDLLKSL